MSETTRRFHRATPARGFRKSPGSMVKVVVNMDPETFERVRSRAAAVGTSMAEEIRTLIEWGLEADEQQ